MDIGAAIARFRADVRNLYAPSDPERAELRLRQLRIVAESSAVSLWQMPILALAVCAVFSPWVPIKPLIIWAALVSIAAAVTRVSLSPILDRDPSVKDITPLTLRFAFADFITICIWSSILPITWMPDAPATQTLGLLVVAATMASAASFSAACIPIIVADLLPLSVAGILPPIVFGGFEIVAISLASALYTGMIVSHAATGYNLAARTILLDQDRQRLIIELQAANRAKSEFLAHMSHELRTPLNAIIGFSEVMRDQHLGPLNNERYRAYAGDINESGQHLLSLINDVLDLSKIEAGKLDIEERPVVLRKLGEDVLRLFHVRAERGRVRLLNEVPAKVTLLADERALKQVLINLISNAVKFTGEDGSVTLRAAPVPDGSIRVEVRDTGKGISPDDMARLFTPFGQGRSDISREQGTGLGLAIVKGIMEAHGGAVAIASVPNKGTTVTCTFPKARVGAARDAA